MVRPFRLPRYVVPILAIAGAVALSLSLRLELQLSWPGQVSSPLLLVAVAVSAWYGGTGPGVIAAGLSLLSLEILFLPPTFVVDLGWEDLPRLGTFFGASLLVAWMTAARRQAESALEQTRDKLRAARTVQQRLFPPGPPARPGLDAAGVSLPANTVGGDYFDYIPLPGGALGVVAADVSGHGLGPALLMAEVRAYLRALALTDDDLGRVLTLTNRVLTADTAHEFVTLFFAAVDDRAGRLTYAGAGHEAYLLDPAGGARRLCSTSLPLGLERDLVVPCADPVPLAAGQVLLVVTDGVTETRSPGGEMYGIDRCLETARANRVRPPRDLIQALAADLHRFADGRPRADDVTMVAVKVRAVG